MFAVGLVFAPLACLRSLLIDLRTLNGDAYQVFLADHPGRAALLLFGAATTAIFLVGTIALNILFFRTRKELPFWAIAALAGQCAFLLILQGWLLVIHSDSLKAASLSGLAAVESLIWIAYLARSRRVKQTFVN